MLSYAISVSNVTKLPWPSFFYLYCILFFSIGLDNFDIHRLDYSMKEDGSIMVYH
ncbi:hypothetical protein BCR42DRAFT_420469 [Absidia repens]|uniref:Uncharacterized protein n=1 Tax=Absidia repens TaxID=90262 RepID=A0A1X2I9U3_9FUNG|nr:hypothetical protein BCR42DRAFT_420469 [Absidia repens]